MVQRHQHPAIAVRKPAFAFLERSCCLQRGNLSDIDFLLRPLDVFYAGVVSQAARRRDRFGRPSQARSAQSDQLAVGDCKYRLCRLVPLYSRFSDHNVYGLGTGAPSRADSPANLVFDRWYDRDFSESVHFRSLQPKVIAPRFLS